MFNLTNPFKKKVPEIPVLEEAIAEQTPDLVYRPGIVFQKGKWVMYRDQIGIVASVIDHQWFEFHAVNPAGETISSERVQIGSVRIARHMEIPVSRRHPNPVHAAVHLGYV